MPHPIDGALAGAVGDVIGWLKEQGMSTRDIATRFEVSDSTITRWENGKRTPRLDQLPLLDELAEQAHGYILRLAGYVDDPRPGDVLAAIATDPRLGAEGKTSVRQVYGVFVKRSQAANVASAQPEAK